MGKPAWDECYHVIDMLFECEAQGLGIPVWEVEGGYSGK